MQNSPKKKKKNHVGVLVNLKSLYGNAEFENRILIKVRCTCKSHTLWVDNYPKGRRKQRIIAIHGQNLNGLNPMGKNPLGQNPFGKNPSGLNPSGLNPSGLNPSGLIPSGLNPSGINARGLNPSGLRHSKCLTTL